MLTKQKQGITKGTESMKKGDKNKTVKRGTKIKTLSLRDDLVAGGEARAREVDRSFSSYVATLIRRDIKESADLAV